MNAIVLDGASKDYDGRTVLDGVSLAIPEGRCVALIGHNGAGKTTLMKLVLGLIAPTRGTVSVLGQAPAKAGSDWRRLIGFLPENVAFHDQITGADTLMFLARLKGASPSVVTPLLERVGLQRAAANRVKTYSKGMRQRLGLAQALIGKPRLLLLDEPTTGLDPVLRQEFFDIIRHLTESGATVVLSSHILTELEARTDIAAILRDGKLAAFGGLEALRNEAGLPVTVRAKGNAPAIAGKLNGSFSKTVSADKASIDIDCPPAKKMALLRTLAGLSDICMDVDVRLPSLDDLYLHYSGRRIGPDVTMEDTA